MRYTTGMTNPKNFRVNDTVQIDGQPEQYTITGTARYAGSQRTGSRLPGISVRPVEGGRARVVAERRVTAHFPQV